jgi:hypothetical protein
LEEGKKGRKEGGKEGRKQASNQGRAEIERAATIYHTASAVC